MKKTGIMLILLFLMSCGKEIFAPQTQTTTATGTSNAASTYMSCAGHTLIRPYVDVLFVVDNSGSASVLTDSMKQSLFDTISYLATNKFDYHVVISGLFAPASGTDKMIVTSYEPISGVSTTPMSSINIDDFFNVTTGSSGELGFQRVHDIISNNRSNGIFRDNSNTIVVLISNGDDTDYVADCRNCQPEVDNFTTRYQELLTLKDSLDALQFRFISIVPHQLTSSGICQKYVAYEGTRYKRMSQYLYTQSGASDQSSRDGLEDSYDICQSQYTTVFETINKSINKVTLSHKYDYWPISSTPNIDVNKIVVKKYKDGILQDTLSAYPGDPNGFEYVSDYLSNQNTRYEPTAGEPKSGYFIRLHGDGRVTYPECLEVQTQAPADYYGYIVLPQNPDLETVSLTINGNTISQSAINGWTYYGFYENFNIRVTSKTDDTALDSSPYKPAIKESGYFLKLHGNAIYTNSDQVEINYKANAL